jgi:peptidoglycan hydrolase FlgJ
MQPISALQTLTALKDSTGPTFSSRAARDVPKEFEAFVLQSFIQEMLPKKAEDVYGKGVSGDIWRSMLAEKLAAEVTERGGLGIADQVRAEQIRKSANVLPGALVEANAAPGAEAAPASSELVSSGWQVTTERS